MDIRSDMYIVETSLETGVLSLSTKDLAYAKWLKEEMIKDFGKASIRKQDNGDV